MPIEPGDAVPPATLKQMTADGIKDVDLETLVSGKKVILFGLPGAYTPVCSTAHLPGYIAEADRLKSEGIAEIVCIAVNDPFVMSAWEKEQGATGKVLMLCDPDVSFTRSLGLSLDLSAFGLGERSQRYSMIVQDGVVATINVEKSIFDHEASAASSTPSRSYCRV
jgi:glutaredoxin/glutathione-dependent peroxiredoxin